MQWPIGALRVARAPARGFAETASLDHRTCPAVTVCVSFSATSSKEILHESHPAPGRPRRLPRSGPGLALVPAVQAHAASTFVACGDIAGLRAAITAFNASGSGDIALQSGCTYTVVNADNDDNGMPVIAGNIRIVSYGATIARSTAPATPLFRLFSVGSGGSLTLNRVNLTGGLVTNFETGGAVHNQGSLTVAGATLSGNGAGDGGAISNDSGATAVLNGATVSRNTANFGGGVYNGGTLTINYSTVQGNAGANTGGGLLNVAGQTNLVGSRITGNTATNTGGGVDVGGGQVSDVGSTISGNTPNNCAPSGSVPGCTG
ncbi:hypothetical protein [Kitasatospora sp. NPDC058190]|uniref:hypothetical protein n=1 Tax=Kitasatospora sp. NPDC058190 TaxID=3346371 RepID=UPI0036DD5D73